MISEKAVEMPDTGKIAVRNINFDTAKWTLRPESFAVLDEIGGVLIQRQPTLWRRTTPRVSG